MKLVIFTKPEDSAQALIDMRDKAEEVILAPTYITSSSDRVKAEFLVKHAPAYANVNHSFMTAERGASVRDVLKMYRIRQERAGETACHCV